MPRRESELVKFILVGLFKGLYQNMFWINFHERIWRIDTVNQRNRDFTEELRSIFKDYVRMKNIRTDPQTAFFAALNRSRFFDRQEHIHEYQFSENIQFDVDEEEITAKLLYNNKWKTFVYKLHDRQPICLESDDNISCPSTILNELPIENQELLDLYVDLNLSSLESSPVSSANDVSSDEVTVDQSLNHQLDLSFFLPAVDMSMFDGPENVIGSGVAASCSSKQKESSEFQPLSQEMDLTVCGNADERTFVNAEFLDCLSTEVSDTAATRMGFGNIQIVSMVFQFTDKDNQQQSMLISREGL